MTQQIYISLGSNIDARYHLTQALDALAAEFGELTLSSVFESEAVGFRGDNFLNMVVGAKTDRSIEQVVACFKSIEAANGRIKQAQKFSPRTLDLDLLTYGDTVCQHPIELPRDEITKNAFVLWPLAEIAALELHPILNQDYQTLWNEYDKAQKLWKIEFQWPKDPTN
ncbi:2-amino-4-hydroxy-6-hydroxymethyldihydropteridine diphosphokinase [Paraferrimonas haliotis]|uniref:2-amino-4-hydroxy-6-hydroxymethyldihydropteridine diphosphokinase n=1 Tax=Paraferrimonas haliotis TaxID=2013866 RepID=A0AA37TJ49_9GAMM|nr:2-amino-4-hydroxy-6-hydroxymethyldihydropteridine diphosphokinase [Paraferrimonas haliotis]GLS82462.1 2-amino-4-hydroxy-6-hydroxymethyldihydropteridine diphosphokinase [Paraferrimonas haliotis]